jgi:hypothetical protein
MKCRYSIIGVIAISALVVCPNASRDSSRLHKKVELKTLYSPKANNKKHGKRSDLRKENVAMTFENLKDLAKIRQNKQKFKKEKSDQLELHSSFRNLREKPAKANHSLKTSFIVPKKVSKKIHKSFQRNLARLYQDLDKYLNPRYLVGPPATHAFKDAGLLNNEIVVNNLGVPANLKYTGDKKDFKKGYDEEDMKAKVIVERFKLPTYSKSTLRNTQSNQNKPF